MGNSVSNGGGSAYQVASSHLITTCATLAALILFVFVAAQVLPSAIGLTLSGPATESLAIALLLNIAIILFGWRRSKELTGTLAALKAAEQEALDNAYTDHTTGLGNRRALLARLEQASRERHKGVLLLIDLDHFKKVNDRHGHSAGDELLRHVGQLIAAELPQPAFVARLGGDEFAALIRGADEAAEEAARKLVGRLSAQVALGTVRVQVSASAGLARLGHPVEPAELLRRADVAMYSVKRSGRNGFAWFDGEMERLLNQRAALEEEIRAGIEADEFVPFFQPLINLDSGELTGFEVLARWRSPTRGMLEPVDFIDAAEQSGLIGDLSMRVMEKALDEARGWPAHLKLAVNVSPVQFRDPQLAERIVKLLAQAGFPARRLEVEISEGSLLEDRDQAMTIVQSLKNNGITIALDDFGTGYASLGQLHSLPFDRIKIDRAFISSLAHNEQSAAIVETIAMLGKSLKVPVTAEGVETDAIRAQLAALGCSDAQGWYFGRAVSGHVASRQFTSPPEQPLAAPADRAAVKKW